MSSSAGRKSGRGGGVPGRGRGGRGRGSRQGRSINNNQSRKPNNTDSNKASNGNAPIHTSERVSTTTVMPEMKDEEILIAFMPYLKGDNQEAMMIHEQYQSSNDQKAFLQTARQFLFREKSKPWNSNNTAQPRSPPGPTPTPQILLSQNGQTSSAPTTSVYNDADNTVNPYGANLNPFINVNNNDINVSITTSHTLPHASHHQQRHGIMNTAFGQHHHLQQQHQQQQHGLGHFEQGEASPGMDILERKMASLLSDEDDIVSMPFSSQKITGSTIGPSASVATPSKSPIQSLFPSSSPMHQPNQPTPLQQQQLQQQHYQQLQPIQQQSQLLQQHMSFPASNRLPPTTSMGSSMLPGQNSALPASLSSIFGSTNNITHVGSPLFHPLPPNQFQNNNNNNHSMPPNWPTPTPASTPARMTPPAPGLPSESHLSHILGATSISPVHTPIRTSTDSPDVPSQLNLGPEATPAKTPKKEYQPKRLWTHLEEQPGKILANNVAPSIGTVLDLRPRQELTARWTLPLSYLKEEAEKQGVQSIRELLQNLSVGLFRRGCTENGSHASIVSKEIASPGEHSRDDYPYQMTQDAVVGTVPFFSPRTPGHVVFRMYWNDNPLHTLATGPTLNVRVTENDFESSIRFILSNFKGKKVNPTSLSSLNSLALVLEQFQVNTTKPNQATQHQFDSAGRAVWGCVCEARKVLDACAIDYQRTIVKLEKLEESVEELKEVVGEEEKTEKEKSDIDEESTQKSGKSGDGELSVNAALLREKTKMLMSGRASCERKWRDSQLAFASILKPIVSNPAMTLLLRRELITKLRLEYELWCPLCEEFALIGESTDQMWYEPISRMSQPITTEHFRICTEARSKMQMRILGFDPNTTRLENILYPSRGRNRQMNPAAVNVFNQLLSSMGQLYQEVYFTADRIIQQRESIRARVEQLVNMCDCFPPGTKVAIFGSSANGYGSPRSDLDMCLQIPNNTSIVNEDDPTGAKAMATLAQLFEENGMEDVDTVRLTARIPVIKFNCPRGNGSDLLPDEELLMECDLSMHNPLAVLNTSLLRAYAEINPVSRVLASVIKRWAKARDINNPARHTLSSYGYIIMLLHFLTYHQRSGNGLVSPVGKSARGQAMPLLPNLQWMDERWPQSPAGTPYTEYNNPPKIPIQHPIEENIKVNAYFYRPNAAMLNNLQRLFPGQDLSLAILLASFFRYYAYEFDYKRNVVSLNSTVSHGIIEREVKAELDGWRNYSAALTIEDPFETFYDVAHVLRGGYYHRIRREFAVAYSKITDVVSGKTSSSWNNRVVDLTNMSGMALIDWICEPIAVEREELIAVEH